MKKYLVTVVMIVLAVLAAFSGCTGTPGTDDTQKTVIDAQKAEMASVAEALTLSINEGLGEIQVFPITRKSCLKAALQAMQPKGLSPGIF